MSAECPSCSRHVGPDDRFCAGCGSPLESGGEPPAAVSASASIEEQEVIDLARHSKIAAIKRYREIHNSGLAEAKQAVERLMVRHGIIAGGQMEVGKQGGCATVLLIVLSGLFAVIAALYTGP
jgi:hypothetical protein